MFWLISRYGSQRRIVQPCHWTQQPLVLVQQLFDVRQGQCVNTAPANLPGSVVCNQETAKKCKPSTAQCQKSATCRNDTCTCHANACHLSTSNTCYQLPAPATKCIALGISGVKYIPSTAVGKTVAIACRTNAYVPTPSSITCMANGVWTASPTCSPSITTPST